MFTRGGLLVVLVRIEVVQVVRLISLFCIYIMFLDYASCLVVDVVGLWLCNW